MLFPDLLGLFFYGNCLLQGYISGKDLRCNDYKDRDVQLPFNRMKTNSKTTWTADELAQEDVIEIAHDFGQGYGTSHFKPAILRGKEEEIDGRSVTRPLIWGEERLLIELPRPSTGKDYVRQNPSISVSHSSSILAASYGELVSVFKIPEWKRILVLGHEDNVDEVSFSPDGKFLLTKNVRNRDVLEYKTRVWDIAAEIERQKKEEDNPVKRADMEHIQSQIIRSAKEGLLGYSEDWTEEGWLRDAQAVLEEGTKDMLEKIKKRHEAAAGKSVDISGLDLTSFGTDPWSPDGSYLLLFRDWDSARIPKGTNGKPADLVVWDLHKNEEGMLLDQPGHDGPVMWSGFSPDEKLIASSSWDSKVRIWDAKTRQLRFTLQDDSTSQSWTGRFSPDSKYLAVGNGDGFLRLWNTLTGELEHKLTIGKSKRRDWIRGIEFTSDSKSIFFSNGNGCAELYSLEKKETEQQYLVKGIFPDEMQEVQVSPDGKSLGFRIQSGQMTVYQTQTNEKWQVEQTLESDRSSRKGAFGIMRFLDDKGQDAVSYDNDGILRIWRLKQ